MLRTGKWKLTDMAYTYLLFNPGQPGYDTTVHDTLRDCNKDDYFIFGPVFNGTVSSGATKCSASESDQAAFRWQTLNNDTTIILYGLANYGSDTDTGLHYFAAAPGTMHGSSPVFPDPYTATFKNFSQSSMTLRVAKYYIDPNDLRKVDTSFWDYTFVNY